ncbi:exported hypothetical protein [Xenorhabdus sp. KK7.4]|nr:exported hypothetical protein [Xenorhabdus sp. KK7.4]
MKKNTRRAIANIVSLCLTMFFVNKSSLSLIYNGDSNHYYNVVLIVMAFFGFEYVCDKFIKILEFFEKNN